MKTTSVRRALACTVLPSLLLLLLPAAASSQPLPSLSISDVTISEGHSGTVAAILTVTRSGSTAGTTTVDFTTSDETALFDDADYYQTWGTLAFNAGETTQTISVNVVGDTVDEANETFVVTLSNPQDATISDGVGRVTISDDDDPVVVSIGDVVVGEADSSSVPAAFTITLSRAVSEGVSVGYTTANGTATAGSDYFQTSGTVYFGPGQTSRTVSVFVAGDTLDENDETFFVDLTAPSGVVIGDGRGTATIIDNDPASGGGGGPGGGGPGGGGSAPTVSVADASVTEGDSGTTSMIFTVVLSATSTTSVVVDYDTVAGSAGAGRDFVATAGTLTFAPGETSKQIVVPILGDTLDEEDETFQLVLESVDGATFSDPVAAGTITDNDATPVFSVADVEVVEGDSGMTSVDLVLKLSSPSGEFVSVDVATADGTALFSDGDYQSTSGRIVFEPGVTTRTLTLSVAGDEEPEPDEYFLVNFTNLDGATAGDLSARVDIRTDEGGASTSDTTLVVAKRNGLLVARGKVTPQVSGSVTVTLAKKRNGVFRTREQEQVDLVPKTNRAGEQISTYRTMFVAPRRGQCRITVVFPGTDQVDGSRARATFRC